MMWAPCCGTTGPSVFREIDTYMAVKRTQCVRELILHSSPQNHQVSRGSETRSSVVNFDMGRKGFCKDNLRFAMFRQFVSAGRARRRRLNARLSSRDRQSIQTHEYIY